MNLVYITLFPQILSTCNMLLAEDSENSVASLKLAETYKIRVAISNYWANQRP